ncbi:hypothetical protein [Stieleria sp.]|uniref:hypothetical protein n=1 Tax=Stieleria sp. TaxID=2795976 RepID=UPI00356A00DE
MRAERFQAVACRRFKQLLDLDFIWLLSRLCLVRKRLPNVNDASLFLFINRRKEKLKTLD